MDNLDNISGNLTARLITATERGDVDLVKHLLKHMSIDQITDLREVDRKCKSAFSVVKKWTENFPNMHITGTPTRIRDMILRRITTLKEEANAMRAHARKRRGTRRATRRNRRATRRR